MSDPGGDRQYHLAVEPGDVAPTVLLPGDPDRVEVIGEQFEAYEAVASHREYRTITGSTDGTPVSVTSTGIGSPSASIAVEELARVGADTFLRVGSCGAIQPEIELGDLVISRGAVRQEGTSEEYVREDYPAVADDLVVNALVTAAERLGYDYHVGVTMSADSFYAGQSRDGFEGYRRSDADDRLADLQAAGVANVEMEASAVLTLAALYGLRAGAVCTVYADRTTGAFRTDDDQRAAETATLATRLLAQMDERAAAAGADRWHPGLGLED